MSLDVAIAPVRKQVTVEASQARAFEIFTRGVDIWWPKTMGIGPGRVMRSVIEPQPGGRWYAEHEGGVTVLIGRVQVWEPPGRVVFSWEISADWKPHPGAGTASEVEVRFIAEGPQTTRVELEHRGFARMENGAKMRADVDGGWPGLLDLFAQAARAAP